MQYTTKAQRGSPSRDRFKHLHKQMLPKEAWALDVDLELVAKYPFPFVVARIDFKLPNDSIGFTEALSYQNCLDLPEPHAVPVYIVESNEDFGRADSPVDSHRFSVFRLVWADYKPFPPTFKLELVAGDLDWRGLSQWEMDLRTGRQREMAAWARQARRQTREQAIAYVI